MIDLRPLCRGTLRARPASSGADIGAALALRARVFRAGAPDEDILDRHALHVLIEPRGGGPAAGCLRLIPAQPGGAGHGYAGRFYDLAGIDALDTPTLEVGRVCLAPEWRGTADALRLVFAVLTRAARQAGAGLLFGCASLAGADPARHRAALSRLAAAHLAPAHLAAPARAGAATVLVRRAAPPARSAAAGALPPLLRGYMAMGGMVGHHAVIDRDLDTVHVLAMLAPAALPQGRRRVLEAEAG